MVAPRDRDDPLRGKRLGVHRRWNVVPLLAAVRKVLALVTVLAGFAVSLVIAAAPAGASSEAYDFLSRVNSARSAHGLKPLAMKSDLVDVAYSWTKHMAANNSLAHNPNLTTQVKNWQAVGENVGVGPTVKDIEDAFMASTHHRENILDPAYTEVGIATVRDSSGQLWVTQDFRQPMRSTSTTTTTQPRTTTHTTSTAPRTTTAARPTSRTPVVVRNPLADRLAQLTKSHAAAAGDPLVRAMTYVTTMAQLTTTG
jgi:hypothetical protein